MNFIITLLILAIVLGLIIFIHEFGHFIAAKKSGVYVDEFSLGMGPLLFKYKPKKSETTYSLRLLPIGGFVSMAEKEDPENKKVKKDRVLENKGFFKTFWVLINGIIFNCLLAIILFFISGLIYGRPINNPIIFEVLEDSAAYDAGLEAGDTIIKLNDTKIDTYDDFTLEFSTKEEKNIYKFEILKKDGSIKIYDISPKTIVVDGVENKVFGFTFSSTHEKGFKNAVIYGFEGFYDNLTTIIKILGSLITGEVSANNLSGPVGIYSIIDTVKSEGLETIIYITAYLSINVGIVNLIPIPVFDGGRVLLLIIEKIRNKKTNEKTELILNYVGFGLMILLMIYVTFNDIIRLVVK